MNPENLTIVVCCNKKDFFLARICIASIRYYYPCIEIELVKDTGNGKFSTGALEKAFEVKLVDLGKKKLGWSGAKFHYLYQMPRGKKVLILDADIVFAGPFLERLKEDYSNHDYVVSAEPENPYADWVTKTYFDTRKIENLYPDYTYPGYFFNAGQIFVTVGAIEEDELNKYFDKNVYPYWKNQEIFPLVDQSVYNYLLPTLAKKKKISLKAAHFMLWSKSEVIKNLSLDTIMKGTFDGGLIHWAGERRPYLQMMIRCDILYFFEKFYYKKIRFGKLQLRLRKVGSFTDYSIRKIYRTTKKLAEIRRHVKQN